MPEISVRDPHVESCDPILYAITLIVKEQIPKMAIHVAQVRGLGTDGARRNTEFFSATVGRGEYRGFDSQPLHFLQRPSTNHRQSAIRGTFPRPCTVLYLGTYPADSNDAQRFCCARPQQPYKPTAQFHFDTLCFGLPICVSSLVLAFTLAFLPLIFSYRFLSL